MPHLSSRFTGETVQVYVVCLNGSYMQTFESPTLAFAWVLTWAHTETDLLYETMGHDYVEFSCPRTGKRERFTIRATRVRTNAAVISDNISNELRFLSGQGR